jgi:hypothetical protein
MNIRHFITVVFTSVEEFVRRQTVKWSGNTPWRHSTNLACVWNIEWYRKQCSVLFKKIEFHFHLATTQWTISHLKCTHISWLHEHYVHIRDAVHKNGTHVDMRVLLQSYFTTICNITTVESLKSILVLFCGVDYRIFSNLIRTRT